MIKTLLLGLVPIRTVLAGCLMHKSDSTDPAEGLPAAIPGTMPWNSSKDDGLITGLYSMTTEHFHVIDIRGKTPDPGVTDGWWCI